VLMLDTWSSLKKQGAEETDCQANVEDAQRPPPSLTANIKVLTGESSSKPSATPNAQHLKGHTARE